MAIWFKQNLSQNDKALVYNGSVKLFSFNGTLKAEGLPLVPMYIKGAVPVKVISLVKSGISSVDVGVEDSTGFKRVGSSAKFETIMSYIMSCGGYIGVLKRNSAVMDNGVSVGYVQVLFVFVESVDLTNLITVISSLK